MTDATGVLSLVASVAPGLLAPVASAGGAAGIGGGHQFIDSPGVWSVHFEYRVGVSDRVPDPDIVGEQHSPSVGRIASRGGLERDEAVADLVVVHPGSEAQFAVEANAWLANLGKRVFPAAERLVAPSTDEVGPDIDVMDEPELVPSPQALGLCGIRVEALVPLEAAQNRQPGMVGKRSKRGVQPVGVTRNEVIVLDETDDLCTGEPDRSIKDPDLM